MIKVQATTHPAPENKLAEYIKKMLIAKVDYVHFDIMDGKFVETKTFGYTKILKMRELFPTAKFAIHLMTTDTEKIIGKFLKSKPSIVYLHAESFNSTKTLLETLNKIKKENVKAGISIKPETLVDSLDNEIISNIDACLIMGVQPGKSGQKLLPHTLLKAKLLKEKNKKIEIAFDGGLNKDNYKIAIDAGVSSLAFGSFLYNEINAGNGKLIVKEMKEYKPAAK